MLKSIATIATMLVALIVLGVGGWLWWQHVSANHALIKAQETAGHAVIAQNQADDDQAVEKILARGGARDARATQIHAENTRAIEAAPGGDRPLAPALIDAANRGLCRHEALAADPRYPELCQAHPAAVSDAYPGPRVP